MTRADLFYPSVLNLIAYLRPKLVDPNTFIFFITAIYGKCKLIKIFPIFSLKILTPRATHTYNFFASHSGKDRALNYGIQLIKSNSAP